MKKIFDLKPNTCRCVVIHFTYFTYIGKRLVLLHEHEARCETEEEMKAIHSDMIIHLPSEDC